MKRSEGKTPDVLAHGGLEIKVCVRTYRLFFVSHSEDSLVRLRSPDEYVVGVKGLKAAATRRRKWLDELAKKTVETPEPVKTASETPMPQPSVL